MYNSKEIANILGVSDKSVRRYLNSYFSIQNGSYQVSDKMLEVLKDEYKNEDSDIIVQPFTVDEYDEFRRRLTEYPMFKKHVESLQVEIEYHKNQYQNLMALHREFVKIQEKALDNLTQRNFIEAKEKGFHDID
ncbi:hypothetical protein [Flavobacterium frigidarium]|uniref:hypothetical protein n=1 Tax=Flavobacterium frigidarium TaxID=99286 RepID=UPI0004211A6E|nr:hypothetical protein [Flavobacterium frigidarium]